MCCLDLWQYANSAVHSLHCFPAFTAQMAPMAGGWGERHLANCITCPVIKIAYLEITPQLSNKEHPGTPLLASFFVYFSLPLNMEPLLMCKPYNSYSVHLWEHLRDLYWML